MTDIELVGFKFQSKLEKVAGTAQVGEESYFVVFAHACLFCEIQSVLCNAGILQLNKTNKFI